MKRSKLLVLLTILMLALTIALVACAKVTVEEGTEQDNRNDGDSIESAKTEIDVGADYIEFTKLDGYRHPNFMGLGYYETSLDEVLWEEKFKYEGLEPVTQYNIFVRNKETEVSKAGPSLKLTATTLKMTPTKIPNTTIVQENNIVTVVDPNDEFEVSFDNENTYSDVKTHTYPPTYIDRIYVRYKETDKSFVSEPQEIIVHIRGFYAGTGTKTDPYLINKYEQLLILDKGDYDLNCYFKLLNDITFPEEALTQSLDASVVFASEKINLDGNGFKFINPKMNYSRLYGAFGLFARLSTASNLTIENAELKVQSERGTGISAKIGILGGSESVGTSLINCHVSGKIVVSNSFADITSNVIMIGGLTGEAISIENCSSDVSITYVNAAVNVPQAAAAGAFIGGLAGKATTIKNSFAKVNISSTTASGFVTVGGLVGEAAAKAVIENSFATRQGELGAIVIAATGVRDYPATEVVRLGGLVGHLIDGTVKNVYADINLSVGATTINSMVGGVIGVTDQTATPINNKLVNSFYKGRIAVEGGVSRLYTVAVTLGQVSPLTIENSYHDSTMPNLGTGSGEIDNASSTAASEENLLSAAWQKANLKFDEEIWEFTDGKLPQLKK